MPPKQPRLGNASNGCARISVIAPSRWRSPPVKPDLGSGKLLFSGSYTHQDGDIHNGDLHVDVTAQALTASRIAELHRLEPGAEARLDGKAAVDIRIERGELQLRSISGEASARGVTLDQQKLGDVNLTAATSGNELALQAKAQVRGTTLEGQGKWSLEGDYPGSGTLSFSRLTVATLHDLVMLRGTAAQKAAAPPFEGFLEGGATVNVALRNLRGFRADVKIDTLQIDAKPGQSLRLDVQTQDVRIRNTQPILVTVSAQEARIDSAHFTARDTNLEATGVIPFNDTGGANLAIKGSVNLAELQLFNADLAREGNRHRQCHRPRLLARSANERPHGIQERLALYERCAQRRRQRQRSHPVQSQSRHHRNFDGGNRRRSKSLSAGFLEFGDILIYRLQADVQQVRVRYPEDVSFTSNAQLALNGTSDASTLSGTVTLNRAAISAGADLGAAAGRSLQAVARAAESQRVSARHALRRAPRKRAAV